MSPDIQTEGAGVKIVEVSDRTLRHATPVSRREATAGSVRSRDLGAQ